MILQALAVLVLVGLLLTLDKHASSSVAVEVVEPEVIVDAHGNMHINTSRADASVFVNGRSVDGELAALRRELLAQLSTSAEYGQALLSLDAQYMLLSAEVSASEAELSQLRRTAQRFSPEINITTTAHSAFSVIAADVDGDSDMDVLCARRADDTLAWYENLNGKGMFSSEKIITSNVDSARSVFAADLDGDGDIDVLSASLDDKRIAWYENTDGEGSFSAQQDITTSALGAICVHAADLDGDGHIDVLSASQGDDMISWYRNEDGDGSFSSRKTISSTAFGASSVFAADLNGDGDMDVLSTSHFDNKVAWYENTDGSGTFSEEIIISTNAVGARAVFAADLDGDGDLDVLSASQSDNTIAWYENLDGGGNFSGKKVITTDANGARSVVAADLDGDGDMDVLSASYVDNKVAWYENRGGNGTFSQQKVISRTADTAFSVFAADLNGDGFPDVLSASQGDDKVAWYENLSF